jgi:carbon-monoxide dehydrogenase small subunit
MDVLQKAFLQEHAVQCGFCTPGMLMSARALLLENPDPSEQDIRVAISGNLCRCTGYLSIIKAIRSAAATIAAEEN